MTHFLLLLVSLFGQLRHYAWFVIDPLSGVVIAISVPSWPLRVGLLVLWTLIATVPRYCLLFGLFIEYTAGDARRVGEAVIQIPVAKRMKVLLIEVFRTIVVTTLAMCATAMMFDS